MKSARRTPSPRTRSPRSGGVHRHGRSAQPIRALRLRRAHARIEPLTAVIPAARRRSDPPPSVWRGRPPGSKRWRLYVLVHGAQYQGGWIWKPRGPAAAAGGACRVRSHPRGLRRAPRAVRASITVTTRMPEIERLLFFEDSPISSSWAPARAGWSSARQRSWPASACAARLRGRAGSPARRARGRHREPPAASETTALTTPHAVGRRGPHVRRSGARPRAWALARYTRIPLPPSRRRWSRPTPGARLDRVGDPVQAREEAPGTPPAPHRRGGSRPPARRRDAGHSPDALSPACGSCTRLAFALGASNFCGRLRRAGQSEPA